MLHVDSTSRRLTFDLPATGSHIGTARTIVRRTLRDWGCRESLTDDVTLAVSELTTNVVVHCRAATPIFGVSLSEADGSLILEVTDPDYRSLPMKRCAAEDETTGRGLALVEMTATEWGIVRHAPVGKTVWACFKIPQE